MAVALEQSQTIDLRPENLNRTIVALSVPSVVESILITLVYLVDTVLIGWLDDPVALAAVGLSSTLMWAADGLFQAIAVSASAPAASQARAKAGRSPASGLSLTQSGSEVAARTRAVTCAAS